MAINLAEKYSDKIVKKFTKSSYTAAWASSEYDWDGVKSIKVYTPVPVDLTQYDRTKNPFAANGGRFGVPTEMQDVIQTLTLEQEPAFAATIDKGNNSDQMKIKAAGKMMKMQIANKVTPYTDKYCFNKWASGAGIIFTETADLAVGNIVARIMAGATAMDNELVPDENRTVFIGASCYDLLRQADPLKYSDGLQNKAVSKGVVGSIAGMTIVKVPDRYLPKDVNFMIVYKHAVLAPTKLKTSRILTEVAGLDGSLLEYRQYFDAFVLAQQRMGIYVSCKKNGSAQTAAPTVAGATGGVKITAAAGALGYYTLDGTDPSDESNAARTAFTGTGSAVTVACDAGTTLTAYLVGTENGLRSANATGTAA
ncbi:MAG: hypothetical protein ACOX7J_00235 [Bacillota bacterium]|jgi:hypothetical protein